MASNAHILLNAGWIKPAESSFNIATFSMQLEHKPEMEHFICYAVAAGIDSSSLECKKSGRIHRAQLFYLMMESPPFSRRGHKIQ
jgi:hypothetical protein